MNKASASPVKATEALVEFVNDEGFDVTAGASGAVASTVQLAVTAEDVLPA
jgi:hypothetical protein